MLVFKAWRKSPALTQETTPSQRRITRILSEAQQAAAVEFGQNLTTVAEALSRGNTDRVVAMLPTEPWLIAQEALAAELLGELLDAGSRVTLPAIEKATLAYSFDRERPESSQWARQAAGTMISQITGEQRNVVRDIVAAAALGEMDWGGVARQVQGSIGLTTQQAGWVANRYDSVYLNALASGMSATRAAAQAREAANRYQTAVHRYRANTIARTETMRAASEGRMQAWNQGITQGFIGANWQKEWVPEADACDICLGLNGKKIGVKESFSVGEPPAHPNCRCDVILVPPKVQPAGGGNINWEGALTAISTLDDLATLGQIGRYGATQVQQWREAYDIAIRQGDGRSFGQWFRDVIEPDITVYADEGPRLTFEEIEDKAEEIFDRAMAIAEEAGRNPLWEQDNGALGDSLLGSLYEYLGFDALPTVLDEDEFETLAAGFGRFPDQIYYRGFGPYLWTGGKLQASQLIDFFRSGRYFPGFGVYGNGTYSANVPTIAMGYAQNDSKQIIRFVLQPSAVIGMYNDLSKEFRAWHDGLTPEYKRTSAYRLLSDFGRWSAAKGYDAVFVEDVSGMGRGPDIEDYLILLNRGVAVVPKVNGLGPSVITRAEVLDIMDQMPWEEKKPYIAAYQDQTVMNIATALGYKFLLDGNNRFIEL